MQHQYPIRAETGEETAAGRAQPGNGINVDSPPSVTTVLATLVLRRSVVE